MLFLGTPPFLILLPQIYLFLYCTVQHEDTKRGLLSVEGQQMLSSNMITHISLFPSQEIAPQPIAHKRSKELEPKAKDQDTQLWGVQDACAWCLEQEAAEPCSGPGFVHSDSFSKTQEHEQPCISHPTSTKHSSENIHKRNFLCVIRAKRQLDRKVWQQRAITLSTALLETTNVQWQIQNLTNLTLVTLRNWFLREHTFSPSVHSHGSSTPRAEGAEGTGGMLGLMCCARPRDGFCVLIKLMAKPMDLSRASQCPSSPIWMWIWDGNVKSTWRRGDVSIIHSDTLEVFINS